MKCALCGAAEDDAVPETELVSYYRTKKLCLSCMHESERMPVQCAGCETYCDSEGQESGSVHVGDEELFHCGSQKCYDHVCELAREWEDANPRSRTIY